MTSSSTNILLQDDAAHPDSRVDPTARCVVHYRKNEYLPSVEASPSVRPRALGKDVVCRVPGLGHSAKKRHTAGPEFAECRPSANNSTRQRVTFAECWPGGTRQSLRACPHAPAVRRPSVELTALSLCRVPPPGTRQSSLFAECLPLPSALAWLSA